MRLDEMAEAYHAQLTQSDEAKAYYQRWGISPATVDRFRLGWVDDPVSHRHAGLVRFPIIPYQAVERTVALRFNVFEFDHLRQYDKGYVERDFPFPVPEIRPFNVANALPSLRTDRVMLVENVRDVLVAKQLGFRVAAIPYSEWHAAFTPLFIDSHVTVVVEHERLHEAARALLELRRQATKMRVVVLPQHHSLSDVLADASTHEQAVEALESTAQTTGEADALRG